MINHAQKLAQYVWDCDSTKESYHEYVIDGNNPVDHVLYSAAVILGCGREFKEDIKKYQNLRSENSNDSLENVTFTMNRTTN